MTKRNYTLVELLTVIFIIGVLAGLIMPATALVRAKAKRTSCSSNLKQVGALAMQFSNDRDGQIPLYYVNPDSKDSYYPLQKKEIENAAKTGSIFSPMARKAVKDMYSDGKSALWTHALVRYAKYNMNVFFCPADERRKSNGDYVTLDPFQLPGSSDTYNDIKNDSTRSSYSMNYGSSISSSRPNQLGYKLFGYFILMRLNALLLFIFTIFSLTFSSSHNPVLISSSHTA